MSSYSHSSDATKAYGNVRIIMDCRENQQDRDVLIVEDILDSGHTLDYLIKNFKSRYTKSVKTMVLVRKKTELKGTPNELKLKYLADNQYKHLSGAELKAAIEESIKAKEGDLVGNMASEGTTHRQLTDLPGSLSDLTSGSGDKGTPVVLIQGYFDNYTSS